MVAHAKLIIHRLLNNMAILSKKLFHYEKQSACELINKTNNKNNKFEYKERLQYNNILKKGTRYHNPQILKETSCNLS